MCFVVVLAQSSATARAYAGATRRAGRHRHGPGRTGRGQPGRRLHRDLRGERQPDPNRGDARGGGPQPRPRSSSPRRSPSWVLLVAGPVLTDLPVAVLAAVVAMIAIRLIDLPAIVDVFHRRRVEGAVVIATAVTVIAAGVGPGILFAMGLSVVVHPPPQLPTQRAGTRPRPRSLADEPTRARARPPDRPRPGRGVPELEPLLRECHPHRRRDPGDGRRRPAPAAVALRAGDRGRRRRPDPRRRCSAGSTGSWPLGA
jgi:hypothetical protein